MTAATQSFCQMRVAASKVLRDDLVTLEGADHYLNAAGEGGERLGD